MKNVENTRKLRNARNIFVSRVNFQTEQVSATIFLFVQTSN
ncbi:hypothetical protein [Bacteroides finegoldii]|nr:hypothetical protein [Bacteroides finegoldii]